jgi:hypothetical protein
MADRARQRATEAKVERVRPVPPASAVPEHAALALQRTAGNRVASALLRLGQPKLAVGAADDRYEQEADAVAAEVMRRLRSGGDGGSTAAPTADGAAPASVAGGHEHSAACGHDEHLGRRVDPNLARGVSRVQRRVTGAEPIGAEGGDVDRDTEARIQGARGSGSGLPGAVRGKMEQAMGADLSSVRIHNDTQSAALNRQVGALAFTVGSDIFMGGGAPSPSSPAGEQLLAHELTHTIQQGAVKPHAGT